MKTTFLIHRLARLASVAAVWAVQASGQEAVDAVALGNASTGQVVYVERFGQNRSLPAVGEVSETAASLIRLRLLTIPGLRVETETAPKCESAQSAAAHPDIVGENSSPGSPSYYAISGYIEASPARQDRFEVLLGYKLLHCENAKATEVYRHSAQVPETGLYESLHVMSDVLGLRLQREVVARVSVQIGPFDSNDHSEKAKKVTENVTDFLANRIESSDEFEVAESANRPGVLAIVGTIRFKKDAGSFDLELALKTSTETKKLFTIQGSSTDLVGFGRTVSSRVFQALLEATARARSAKENSPVEAARALLCLQEDKAAACTPQPKVASALIAKLPENEISAHERARLLGNASFAGRDFAAAAKYAEQAVQLAPNDQPAWRAHAMQDAAEAWSSEGSYQKAADSYKKLLAEIASAPEGARASFPDPGEIRRQLARSLQLGGSKLEALAVLIEAAPKGAPIPRDIHDPIVNLLDGISPTDAGSALDAVRGILPATDRAYISLLWTVGARALSTDNDYPKAIRVYSELESILESLTNTDREGLATAINQIGVAYDDQSDIDRAGDEYRRAIEVQRSAPGGNIRNLAIMLENLADDRQKQTKYAEAEKLLLEARETRRKYSTSDPVNYVSCLAKLASLYRAWDKTPQVEAMYSEALDFGKKLPTKEPSTELLRALTNLAWNLDKYSDAEVYAVLVASRGRIAGLHDPRMDEDLATLGYIYEDEGKYPDALTQYQDALKLAESSPATTPATLSTRVSDLTTVYVTMSDFQKAEGSAQRALKIALDNEHLRKSVTEASARFELGVVFRANGQYQQAFDQFDAALKLAEGLKRQDLGTYLNGVGLTYRYQGRYREALEKLDAAYTIRKNAYGPESLSAASALSNLGDLYRLTGDLAKAEETQLKALGIKRTMLGLSPESIATCEFYLAEVYRDLKMYGAAEARYREAQRLEASIGISNYLDGLHTRLHLADLLRLEGKSGEASGILAPIYDQIARSWPRHPYFADACETLALLKQSEKQLEDAERLLKTALDVRKSSLPADHPLIAQTLAEYAAVLRSAGRPGEADEREAEARDILRQHAVHDPK